MTTPLLRAGSPAARAAYDLARGERIVQLCTEPGTDRLSGVASALVYLLERTERTLPNIEVLAGGEAAIDMGEELIRGFAAAGRQACWEPRQDAIKLTLERWHKGVWIDVVTDSAWTHPAHDSLLVYDAARSGPFPTYLVAPFGQLLLVHSALGLEGPVTDAMVDAVDGGWPHNWCTAGIPTELVLAGAG